MKAPAAFAIALERLGKLILRDERTYDEAVDELEVLVGKAEFTLFVRDVMRRFLRKQLRGWITEHLSLSDEEEQTGQGVLPFPDLPALLEVAPATFKHQQAMTAADWKAAVTQARTKSDNAASYFARVERAAERALKLLGLDDDCTLGDLDEGAA